MKVTKIANDKPGPKATPDDMVTLIDTLKLFQASHGSNLDKHISEMVDNLPSSYMVRRMTRNDLDLLFETVGHAWKGITGEKLSSIKSSVPANSITKLDGNYWLLPGGMMIRGLNHYSAAKRHKNMICSLLNINPFTFEHKLHDDPQKIIHLVLAHGAIRAWVSREKSQVYFQTTEDAWPWALEKLRKMYHKKKLARVLDSKSPYRGWKSGVPVLVK